MDLTNEDVADILALLDSLPYDEVDLQTSKFRLTLRRKPDGGWTQESQVTTEPQVIPERTADGDATAGGARAAQRAGASERAPGIRGEETATAGGARAAQRAGASEHRRGSGEPRRGPEERGPLPAQPDGTAGTGAGFGGSKGGEAPLGKQSIDLTSPLPGTFYRAPRPGAAPFVEVGSVVSEDTVVAIVETMKLMNTVHAGTRGRVAEICVGNAEPVTLGAVLLRIDPEAP